jgi:DNA-binding LytR/AlgR family response regulator
MQTFNKITMNPKIHLVGKKNVLPQNVIYLKAEANYSEVFFTNGESIIISKTLKQMETRFSQFAFFRAHKSYLINLSHVKDYKTKCESKIKLSNDVEIELSRRKRNDFLSVIKEEKSPKLIKTA